MSPAMVAGECVREVGEVRRDANNEMKEKIERVDRFVNDTV